MMCDKDIEMLEKQLELFSERSMLADCSDEKLIAFSRAMCEIANAITVHYRQIQSCAAGGTGRFSEKR